MRKINLDGQRIVELYKEYTLKEMATMFNCSIIPIIRVLKDNNIKLRPPHSIKGKYYENAKGFKKGHIPWCTGTKGIMKSSNKFVYLDDKEIIDLYVNGKKTEQKIADMFHCNVGVISDRLRNNSIETRNRHYYDKFIPWNKGKTNVYSEETLEIMSNLKKGRVSPRKGIPSKKDSIDKQTRTMKRLYKEGKIKPWNEGLTKKENIKIMECSKRMEEKNPMNNPIVRNKMKKTIIELRKKGILKAIPPTIPEKRLTKLINDNNLPYKYTGDFKFWIEGKNPDFVQCNGKKKVIEMFGSYWHSPLLNHSVKWKNTYNERIKHYKKYGFGCLIIWENELNNMNNVLEKIKNFEGS